MNFKEIVKKSIVLGLIGVITVIPGISSAYATNNYNENIKVLDNNEETETVNEYLKLKDINEKSDLNLKSMGYSNQDIKQIRGYKEEFRKNIISLNKLSKQNLLGLGYNNEQISIIRNFNGSENQMIRASASCTVKRSKNSFTYNTKTKTSSLIVNVSFAWNGVPLFRGTDLMAVCNGEYMYFKDDSYLNISYYPLNSSGASSKKKITLNISDPGNTGATFKFKVLGNSGLSYAKSGSGKVYLSKKKNLSEVGVGVKYGHSTISLNPSVSFGGGASVSISFSSKVQSIGPKSLICYR